MRENRCVHCIGVIRKGDMRFALADGEWCKFCFGTLFPDVEYWHFWYHQLWKGRRRVLAAKRERRKTALSSFLEVLHG